MSTIHSVILEASCNTEHLGPNPIDPVEEVLKGISMHIIVQETRAQMT